MYIEVHSSNRERSESSLINYIPDLVGGNWNALEMKVMWLGRWTYIYDMKENVEFSQCI